MRGFDPAAAAVIGLLAAVLAAPAAQAQSGAMRFDIPGQALGDALTAFAAQSGQQVLYSEATVRGLRSRAVAGLYPPDQALSLLVQDSGLRIAGNANGVYTLVRSQVSQMQVAEVAGTQDAVGDGRGLYAVDALSVTASRSGMTPDEAPQTMILIGRDEVQRQLAITSNSSTVLSNLLPSYTPSRDKMNGSGETLRGRTPLIMIDGVPQSNPLRPTGREAHTIDYALIDRVEVIQGANAYNGLGATGGIINLVTKRPENGTLNQNVSVQATIPTEGIRSETASYKTLYSLNGRTDDWEYLLSASYEDQGLYKDARGRSIGADNTQGDLMDSRTYDVLAKLGYWIDGDQLLQLSLNRYRIKNKGNYIGIAGDRQAGIPTTSERGTPEGTEPWNDVWTSSISYSHHNLAGMQLSAMVFNQEFEGLFGADNSATFQDPAIAPVGTLYDQSRSVASKYGSKLSLTKDGLFDDRVKLTVGFDTLFDKGKQDLYGTGRTYVPESKFSNYSLFGQAEYKLLDNLVLHAGVRHETADLKIDSYRTLARYNNVFVEGGKLNFDQTLFNGGLVYTPWQGVTLFGSYAEGFGMPDVGRVLRAINRPGLSVAQMNTLEPILTKNIEVGTRLRHQDVDVDLSYFQSDSKFGTRVIAVDGAFLMAREKTRIQGFEAAVGYRLDPAHRLRLSYAHTLGRYDSNDNGSLDARLDGLNVAPNRMVASWSANWNDRISTFVQVNHAFDRSFDEPEKEFKGYTLVDASMEYRLNQGKVTLAMANVFNEDYISYYSQSALIEPMRYFAGRGRTLTLGYSLAF